MSAFFTDPMGNDMEVNFIFDRFEDDSFCQFYKKQKMLKTCKFCGEGGLIWINIGGKWRLIKNSGKLHNCKQYRERKNTELPS